MLGLPYNQEGTNQAHAGGFVSIGRVASTTGRLTTRAETPRAPNPAAIVAVTGTPAAQQIERDREEALNEAAARNVRPRRELDMNVGAPGGDGGGPAVNPPQPLEIPDDEDAPGNHPDPVKMSMFYQGIETKDPLKSETSYMQENNFMIQRGYVDGWDEPFAHPTQAWTLDKSETDEFLANHQVFYSLQSHMEKVFFEREVRINLQHLCEIIEGHAWEWVTRNARKTILRYFHNNGISGRERHLWWTRLENRGLPREVNPQNPQGDV